MLIEDKLTYITPAGKPLSLPKNYKPSFSGLIDGEEPNLVIGIPKGVLLGFKDTDEKKWLANYTKSPDGSITFNGYKNGDYLKEVSQPSGENFPVIVGIENDFCRLEVYYNTLYYTLNQIDNYKGDGDIVRGDKIALSSDALIAKSIVVNKGCIPNNWLELPEIDYDSFTKNVVARYNYYGYGGVLCKLGATGDYYYCNLDAEGNEFYLMWNATGNKWLDWYPPQPNCTSCELRELLTYKALFELLQESGHDALDAIGMVPVIGETADLINAAWYLLEGDYYNASLSGLSIFPVIGDVAGKTLKYVRKVNKTVEVIELQGDALKFFDNAGRSLSKNIDKVNDLESVFKNVAILSESTDALPNADYIIKLLDGPQIEIFLSKINNFDVSKRADCINDLAEVLKKVDGNLNSDIGNLVESWKSFKNAGLDDLARNTDQLAKFDALAKSNNLGLDAKGLEDLLKLPSTKVDAATGLPLKWDNPDKILDAVQRASDANISGLTISHKKFPAPANGTDNFVLKNAKQYQAEASLDAGLSFDNIATDGKLVDRKYGHGNSIFDKVEDELLGTVYDVTNTSRAESMLAQAQRQLNAVGGDGSKLRWEISTETGAGGIKQLFLDNKSRFPGIENIEIKYVKQDNVLSVP